jgi:DNA repair protein RecN (Recombination protein N)
MLEYLVIKNFVIIKNLKLDFSPGLNIFTGETGAGKSIIVDALGLIAGDKVSSSVIGNFDSKTEVEGVINLSNIPKQLRKELELVLETFGLEAEEELIVRREISSQGKTKCFVNDKVVTLNVLKEISSLLLDIHGQNEHQKLLLPKNQLLAYDEFVGNEELFLEYKTQFLEFKNLKLQLEELNTNLLQKKQKVDLLKYQLEEIETAKLKLEDENLEEEFNNIKNSQKIINLISEIKYNLVGDNGLKTKLSYIEKQLTNLSNLLAENEKIFSFDTIYSEIENLEHKLLQYQKKFENYDYTTIDSLVDRIDLIKKLKRKYGKTIEEILSYAKNVKQEIEDIDLNEEKVKDLTSKIDNKLKNIINLAKELSEIRKKYISDFESKIESELKFLGLEKAKFKVNIETFPLEEGYLTETGVDEIKFYISTNPGSKFGELKEIISGGELSRIMLAIKTVLGKKEHTPVMVFDEIDSGLSGPMGNKVGQKLSELVSSNKQIFCVTHLPQLAVFADKHFVVTKFVKKNETYVEVNVLDEKTRVQEIARMLSDGDITDTSLEHAKKLIKESVKK